MFWQVYNRNKLPGGYFVSEVPSSFFLSVVVVVSVVELVVPVSDVELVAGAALSLGAADVSFAGAVESEEGAAGVLEAESDGAAGAVVVVSLC